MEQTVADLILAQTVRTLQRVQQTAVATLSKCTAYMTA